jgi:hypothetical protein
MNFSHKVDALQGDEDTCHGLTRRAIAVRAGAGAIAFAAEPVSSHDDIIVVRSLGSSSSDDFP